MNPADILSRYPPEFSPRATKSLGAAGGFSGSALWRIQSAAGEYCLKRWPAGYSTDRLQYIHRVLHHVSREALEYLPIPVWSRTGASVVQSAGWCWDLLPWMPGQADFRHRPSRRRLENACRALARFHVATSTFETKLADSVSPGLQQRHEWLNGLQRGGMATLRSAVEASSDSDLSRRAKNLLRLFVCGASAIEEELVRAAYREVPLQPCLRDIWHDHVLFTDEAVTGMVDFGALRVESVAGDIARLLGSCAHDDEQMWRFGLEAYADVRRLNADELSLCSVFDRSATLLSGVQWLQWIYVDNRHFDNWREIYRRLDETSQRLAHLISRL